MVINHLLNGMILQATNPSDSKSPTSFPAGILHRGFSKISPPKKKGTIPTTAASFPLIFGYFFGEEVLAPGQKMFDSLAENLNAMVINIFFNPNNALF